MDNILPELIGVVACGGNSSRMGTDKSLLNYHGKPQRYFLYELLKKFCKDVFISCNKLQSEKIEGDYHFIIDDEQYKNNGPLSGLISAHLQHPKKSILYVGCDYPFLNSESIQELISKRNFKSSVVCFKNSEIQIVEPLIAIYENSCFNSLLKYINENNSSLKKFIENENSDYLITNNSHLLMSANTSEDFKKASASFQNKIYKIN